LSCQLQYANDIADLLAPQSGAYYDVWLDGEKFVSVYKEVSTAAAAGLQPAGSCVTQLALTPLHIFWHIHFGDS
jgi:hypothetical protein